MLLALLPPHGECGCPLPPPRYAGPPADSGSSPPPVLRAKLVLCRLCGGSKERPPALGSRCSADRDVAWLDVVASTRTRETCAKEA